MVSVRKLSIKRLGDQAGNQHHGIFDGGDLLGCVHAGDMRDHIKSCMADGFGDLDDLPGSAAVKEVTRGHVGTPGRQVAREHRGAFSDARVSKVEEEVDRRTKRLMNEERLSYRQALNKVLLADPELEQRYRKTAKLLHVN